MNYQHRFIERSNIIHNNKYDYSKVKYLTAKTKVIITCLVHGDFKQTPSSHLSKRGCQKCGILKYIEKQRSSTSSFIEKSNFIHNNKYDYSESVYKTAHIKVKIICTNHGPFYQTPHNHFHNKGCVKCSILEDNKRKSFTNDDFIKRSNKIHYSKYDYSESVYKTAHIKVKIICKKHGYFYQTPNSHINGSGCPNCTSSKVEMLYKKYFDENNIKYIAQYSNPNCKNKNILKFDFLLTKYNILIEIDGKQHFEPMEFFGGKKSFEDIKIRDNIKNVFCIENNIKLIRVPYYDKRSPKLVLNFLNII